MIKIMQSLGLDYNPAINSTLKFEKHIANLNKQLFEMKALAMQGAKDINSVFSSQFGQLTNTKTIFDQYGQTMKTVNSETSKSAKETLSSIKQSTLASMEATAASIQQKASAKGISAEYGTQAGLIRNQLSELQQRLSLEGKLSTQEIKQTMELKEQLNILRSQAKMNVADNVSDPNIFKQGFERRAEWFLTGSLFFGVTNGAKLAVEAISEVEMGITEIARVMEDTSFAFDDYRDNVLGLGVEYGRVFKDVQDISLRWAQAGYNVRDSLELTKTSLLALNTAELDATNATESMIGIMAQWKMDVSDLPLVLDEINKTADDFTVTSQDLVDGLLRSSGAARIMGLSIEQTISLLTVMREASGRTGREVGNALNSILSYVQRPVAIKTFEGLGIDVFADQAKTQFRNVMDIFQDVASKWDTLSTDIQDGFVKSADDAGLYNEELATAIGTQQEWNDLQQRDLSQAAAGVYRRNYFIGMIERLSSAQGVLNNMTDASGYSMAENERSMNTLQKKYESLKASVQQLAVSLGDSGLIEILKALTDAGILAIETFESLPKPMQDFIIATTSVFIAVKTAQQAMKLFGVTLGTATAAKKVAAAASLALATTENGVAVASGAAALASKGFIAANAPLLIIAGTLGVIAATWGAISREAEKNKKLIETTKQNIESLSTEKQGINELANEYKALKEKQDAVTATADEKIRLLEVQKQLAQQYGVSATGIDSEGQAYTDSIELIDQRTQALEREIAAEKELLETTVKAQDDTDIKNLEKALKRKEEIQKRLFEVQKQIDEFETSLSSGSAFERKRDVGGGNYISETISPDNANEYNNAAKQYETELNNEKVAIQSAFEDINNTISDLTANRKQLLKDDAITTINEFEKNGVKVSDSARLFATEFANALGGQTIDIATQREALKTFLNELNSSEFDDLIEKYNEFKLNGDTSGLKETSIEIMKLVSKFTNGKPELDKFYLSMESLFGNGSSIASASSGVFNLSDALTSLNATVSSTISELKPLNQAIEDIRNGQALSIDTILDLMDKYELSADLIKQTADGYTIEVSALENLRSAKIQTAQDSINAERKHALAVKEQVQSRLINYGIEIEQVKNLAKAKEALARGFADSITMGSSDSGIRKELYSEAYKELSAYEKAVEDIEKFEQEAKLMTTLLNDKSYGVSNSSNSSSASTSSSNKALEESLKLLEHKKKISEETVDSVQKEIVELKRINSLYVKTNEERMDMSERLYNAEQRLNALKISQAEETYAREEALIQHWAQLGLISIQDQIDMYSQLYSIKKMTTEEQWSLDEQMFGLYKEALNEQQQLLKDAYDDRISLIEDEAKAKKEAQETIIKGIEEELKLLDRNEDSTDYDNKMSDLDEQLAYWSVRTGEEARQKLADIKKQIDEAEHEREVALDKQRLEDEKDFANENIKAIEEAAKQEIEEWKAAYLLIEDAFDEHSTDIVALAATMSKDAYQQWVDNYLTPLQNALTNGTTGDVGGITTDMGSGESLSSSNAQIYQLAKKIVDLKKEYQIDGDLSAAGRATNYYRQLESLNSSVADQLHKMNYQQASDYIESLPKLHGGGETLSYGMAYVKPGELWFPSDLSTDLKTLIAISSGITGKTTSSSSTSTTDNRREINISNLLNVEHMHMEDEVDSEIISRDLKRAVLAIK